MTLIKYSNIFDIRIDQNLTDKYIRIRPKVDISNEYIFVAKFNIRHTLKYAHPPHPAKNFTPYPSSPTETEQ